MFLELLVICHLTVIAVANPFHKYPFVFLLDVGNEELEKTNTEQIKVSLPGGSLALRYPAIGDGDTISHIRVTGIDFGADLKANIFDGGPGFKYVVLVFMGNPGVAYDAVVTVQTSPNDKTAYSGAVNMNDNNNVYPDSNNDGDDPNDSAEDTSDDTGIQNSDRPNAELMQSSSNAFNYAQNEVVQSNDYNDYDNQISDNYRNDKDIHQVYSESPDQMYSKQNTEVKDYIEGNEADYQDDVQNQNSVDIKVAKYNDEVNYKPEDRPARLNSNINNKYEAQRSHSYDNAKVQSQELIREQEQTVGTYEDPEEVDQMFNDEEIHYDADKYMDSNNNNNYFDSDDSSAVAS